ncbi:hypothetical protein C8Q70DRAFT_164269 [Cubamyces menziesii]|nr:hypothetical protein C8Q70DRAFT_164269 [Cubamyces menziesii]
MVLHPGVCSVYRPGEVCSGQDQQQMAHRERGHILHYDDDTGTAHGDAHDAGSYQQRQGAWNQIGTRSMSRASRCQRPLAVTPRVYRLLLALGPLAATEGYARQAGSLAAAEWRLSDEDMKKLLPSPPSILVHLRLTALAPAVTWVLIVITISTWWACVDRCRATSPHIFLLASIILFAVNLSCAVYFGFMFNSALEDLMRGIRSRLPSVTPLSPSVVDRIPLVVYRAAECGADPSQHVLVPTQWGPAAVASSGEMPPKHGRSSDSLQTSHKTDASIRLPDVEDSTEATPLLDLQGSSDVVNDMEATPLLNLAEGLPGVIQYPTYPYVILPDDEAKCTICLCDFTDPSGLDGVVVHDTQPDVEMERPSEDLGRQGEGVTNTPPLLLRRLSCGHVYHVSQPVFSVIGLR